MRFLAAPLLAVLRLARRIVRALSPRLHDRVMALYRRTPAIQASVLEVKLRQELDTLADLVAYGERERLLTPAVAVRLQHYVRELRDEAFAAPQN